MVWKRGGHARWAIPVALWLGVAAGCGGLELASVLRTTEVTVDGVPDEWQGAITYIEDPNVTLGVMNDDEYCYLCFSTPLKSVTSQILRQGLTVWFDADGGRKKAFGIHCPMGPPTGVPDTLQFRGRMEDAKGFGGIAARGMRAAAGLIEIMGPGKDRRAVVDSSEARGVEVRLGSRDGRIVYELRVPRVLSDAHPYAIGAEAAEVIGIGFEAPAVTAEGTESPPEGGRPGGRGGGPGGGPGGGRTGGGGPGWESGPGGMGRPPGAEGEATKALELWCKVRMAAS
jgi:hypothetical protein